MSRKTTKTVRVRYYDEDGRDRTETCHTQLQRDLILLNKAGPRSAEELKTVSVESVIDWYRQFPIARGCSGRSETSNHEKNARWLAAPLKGRVFSELATADMADLMKAWEQGALPLR